MLVSRLKKQPVSGGIYDYRKGEFNEELYALMEKHIEPLDFYRVMELVLISYLENNGMKLEKKRFNMDILKGFKQIMNKSDLKSKPKLSKGCLLDGVNKTFKILPNEDLT